MEEFKQRIAEKLEEELGLEIEGKEIEVPEPEHGDFAYPAMKAASELGREPRELAEELSEELEVEGVDRIEVAGPGYLNFYVDREGYAEKIVSSAGADFEDKNEKVSVEHTSPNPNKPLHMGTMRTAILGDTVSRIAETLGYEVEVIDLINDLGRQSARTVYAYKNFLEEIDEEDRAKKDDFWIGLLYSDAGEYLKENPDDEEKVQQIIRDIEEGGNDNFELMEELVDKSVRGQLETAYRSNVFYNLITFERDIVRSNLLEECMEKLSELERVHEIEDGEDEGCVVIELSDYEDELGGMKKPYKILFRSDGTATYTAKDIALTMWKFGLLDSDFDYREFDRQPNGEILWSTGGERESGDFGDADHHINVVGEPQSYVMKVLEISLDALGFEEEAENFTHMSFDLVNLPGNVSYSGRKGNWVGKHGDAVLDRCEDLALEEIQDRYEFSEEKEKEIAEKVALAAVRYFITKFNRDKEITFSFEKALDWEGDSGPYLLYSNARAHGILDNAEVKPGFYTFEKDVEYGLIRKISEFEEVIEETFDYKEPAKLTHYLKDLAEKFNSFYHKCPVNSAETVQLKQSRLAIVEAYIQVMEQGLELLGIEPLEEM
ncbi:MAG: arginine--tRNA ligase [Candidatus Nanohaloarchaea archaeon]